MPVTGFPDARRHRFCFRCARWFEPEEGRHVRTALWRPLDKARAAADMKTENTDVFMCLACLRRRTIARAAMVAILVLAVFAGMATLFFVVLTKL